MKKIVMTLVAAAMATAMNAQVYVGGSLGFSFGKDKTEYRESGLTFTDETKTSSIEFLPEIGYNLNDNMAVGVAFGLSYDKYEVPVVDEVYTKTTKGTVYKFNPYFRYYFAKWDKVSLFADAQLGIGFGKTTKENLVEIGGYKLMESTDVKSQQYSFAIVPGIAYTPTEKISIVAKLGKGLGFWHEQTKTPDTYYVNHVPYTYDIKNTSNDFGLNLKTLGLTVGVYYNF